MDGNDEDDSTNSGIVLDSRDLHFLLLQLSYFLQHNTDTIETNTTTRMEEDGASDTNDVACQKDVSVNASLNIVD